MSRTIEPEMVAFLDAKLASNGLAKHAIANRDARTLFRLALESCVGIREKSGNNDGPMVELIQKTIGDANREPWCMGFIQTGIAYAELRCGVVSPISASEHCLTVWNDTPTAQRVRSVPAIGAIVIWKHGSTSSGHTGATIGDVKDRQFSTVEGNTTSGTSPGGAIVREGGGVYVNRRSMDGAGTMKVVGYLKPFA